jgi:LTXXQ motif family protein
VPSWDGAAVDNEDEAMTRFLHATALALVVLCPLGASAQQSPDPPRQWQGAPDGREDILNTAKERLRLTPEQEQLWGRVDEALRKLRARAADARAGEGPVGDTMERLRRRADLVTARAETLRALADAVQPLWNMLSDTQKRDLADLMRLAARGEEPRMTRRERDDRGDYDDRDDRRDRGIQREGRGNYGDLPRDRMDRRDDERRYRRDRDDDDGRDRDWRRYGGWHDRHDRYDPWIMRRERGWDDLYRDRQGRRGWRADREESYGMGRDRFEGRGRREWGDRPSGDRGGYDRRGDYDRGGNRFEDDWD